MKSEEIIEQLTKVRPEVLDEEALEFYNFVMKKLDYIDELEKELKEEKDNEESANGIVSDLLDEIEKKNKEINHWKNGFERKLEDNQENTLELLKQDEQLRKKDKIIDLMADRLIGMEHEMKIFCSIEDVKEYFERKVENEN